MPVVLRKVLRLNKRKYYETHLQIVSALLPVKPTPKEVEVLAAFLALGGDIAKDRFGTTARKMVKSELRLSDGGLGNYLKSLKDKMFIIHREGEDQINPLLECESQVQNYMVQLVNTESE